MNFYTRTCGDRGRRTPESPAPVYHMTDREKGSNERRGMASADEETRERVARKGGEASHGGHSSDEKGGRSSGGSKERSGSSGSRGGSSGDSSSGSRGRD